MCTVGYSIMMDECMDGWMDRGLSHGNRIVETKPAAHPIDGLQKD
jgi:hypothetical protein